LKAWGNPIKSTLGKACNKISWENRGNSNGGNRTFFHGLAIFVMSNKKGEGKRAWS